MKQKNLLRSKNLNRTDLGLKPKDAPSLAESSGNLGCVYMVVILVLGYVLLIAYQIHPFFYVLSVLALFGIWTWRVALKVPVPPKPERVKIVVDAEDDNTWLFL